MSHHICSDREDSRSLPKSFFCEYSKYEGVVGRRLGTMSPVFLAEEDVDKQFPHLVQGSKLCIGFIGAGQINFGAFEGQKAEVILRSSISEIRLCYTISYQRLCIMAVLVKSLQFSLQGPWDHSQRLQKLDGRATCSLQSCVHCLGDISSPKTRQC